MSVGTSARSSHRATQIIWMCVRPFRHGKHLRGRYPLLNVNWWVRSCFRLSCRLHLVPACLVRLISVRPVASLKKKHYVVYELCYDRQARS